MADRYEDFQVVAMDLWEILWEGNLGNFHTLPRVDLNDERWPFPEDLFDYIHLAQLCGRVSDWQQLCQTVFRFVINNCLQEILNAEIVSQIPEARYRSSRVC